MNDENKLFFVEGVAETDLIGISNYVDSLNNAINQGATFIGIISDFGTGKSTLVQKLKNKHKNDGFVNINLWDCGSKSKNIHDKLNIHSVFLHKLIDEIKIKNKSYYKKKIDKNYRNFDIKFITNNKFYSIITFIFVCFAFLDIFEIYKISTGWPKLAFYFALSYLLLFLFLYYKPLLSFKKDDTSRTIDENDTRDLFCEIINYYHQTYNNRLIISLEELDRYDNVETILQYLKEFYNFYVESKKYKDKKYNNVVFLVSIKSASQLCNKKYNVDYIKNLYEKVFDFILTLNPISIQDYDSIVYDLLKSKEQYFPDNIKVPNIEELNEWKYLYKGKNIKIRDIKHRFNFAFSLYMSAKESGIKKPDINKCLFISYLEDEYNEYYSKLTRNDNYLNNILINYSQGKIMDKDNEEYKKYGDVLLEGLNSKYISTDYNYYFFKYPKNKNSLTPYEYELYNAVFYNEDNETLLYAINDLNDNVILNNIKKALNSNYIPNVIFSYSKLLKIVHDNLCDKYKNTLLYNFDLTKDFERFHNLNKYFLELGDSLYMKYMKEYFQIMKANIFSLQIDERNDLRKNIVKELSDSSNLIDFMFNRNNTVISIYELNEIRSFKIALELTDFSKVDNSHVKSLIEKIKNGVGVYKTHFLSFIDKIVNNQNISNEVYKEVIYSIDYDQYKFTKNDFSYIVKVSKKRLDLSVPKNYNNLIMKLNFYCKEFDDYYIDILGDIDEGDVIKDYKNILIKFNTIYENSVYKLLKCKQVYGFNDDLRISFYKLEQFKYYIISTCINKKIFEIEEDKFSVLKDEYLNYFEIENDWKINVGEKMSKFLYENVDFSKLNEGKLNTFVKMEQNINIINSVLNIDNETFINKYLSKIEKIKLSDRNEIYYRIGMYKRNNKLNSSAIKNLKTLTKNKKILDFLDNRKNKNQL